MVTGYMGWDDIWWYSNPNVNTYHSNSTMWLGKWGIYTST